MGAKMTKTNVSFRMQNCGRPGGFNEIQVKSLTQNANGSWSWRIDHPRVALPDGDEGVWERRTNCKRKAPDTCDRAEVVFPFSVPGKKIPGYNIKVRDGQALIYVGGADSATMDAYRFCTGDEVPRKCEDIMAAKDDAAALRALGCSKGRRRQRKVVRALRGSEESEVEYEGDLWEEVDDEEVTNRDLGYGEWLMDMLPQWN